MTRGALIAALLLLTACRTEPPYQGYTGDGSFVDHGPRAAAMRYVIDLGEIDLGVAGRKEFAMAGLPPGEFTVGFRVRARVEPAKPIFETRPITARVRLELTDAGGTVVLMKDGPLHEWTWSGSMGDKGYSFIYWRGEPGDSLTQPGPSDFQAVPSGRYRVAFMVLEPDPDAASYAVRMQAFGGGWKVAPR